MENKSHALAAGTFVIAVAALLIALAAWLARDTSERRIFELSSRDAVTGLSPQAGVRYKGVSVGRVSAIELDTKSPGSVVVHRYRPPLPPAQHAGRAREEGQQAWHTVAQPGGEPALVPLAAEVQVAVVRVPQAALLQQRSRSQLQLSCR